MNRRDFFKLAGKAAGAVGLSAIAGSLPALPAKHVADNQTVSPGNKDRMICFSFYPQDGAIDYGAMWGEELIVSRNLISYVEPDGRVVECMPTMMPEYMSVRVHRTELTASVDGPILMTVWGEEL